jgi:small subunit ribosomal protein S20
MHDFTRRKAVANHPQAEKRNRQRIKKQAHNRHYRATMRTLIKRVQAALEEKSGETAKETLTHAIPLIDRCGQRGVIPKKRASRTISRLTRALSALS